ncbi:hypothetical protein L596_015524 [Steinernema carpocapsae]|uniref:Uncharacterized protein n=1 Tax=Steinernema carpocapsae TaxID=34508 RepID=A0A4U5NG90_STECR|nr:hypothetical protein L596_015524 [Steinernema carpocapsae]
MSSPQKTNVQTPRGTSKTSTGKVPTPLRTHASSPEIESSMNLSSTFITSPTALVPAMHQQYSNSVCNTSRTQFSSFPSELTPHGHNVGKKSNLSSSGSPTLEPIFPTAFTTPPRTPRSNHSRGAFATSGTQYSSIPSPINVPISTPSKTGSEESDLPENASEVSVSPQASDASRPDPPATKTFDRSPFYETTKSSHDTAVAMSPFRPPLKPMVMTERDLNRLQQKAIEHGIKHRTESSCPSTHYAVSALSIRNWRLKVSAYPFSSRDLNLLESAAQADGDCPEYKKEAFQWIRQHPYSLFKDTETTAKYYKLALHDTYVSVKLVLESLDKMVTGGIITHEEFKNSPDIAKLKQTSGTAQLSIQSVSTLVKKIVRDRIVSAPR